MKQSKQFTLKTFKKWQCKEDFSADIDQQWYIVSLVWEVILGSEIYKESVNGDNYADGVASIHLTTVRKHIKTGCLVNWAKDKYSGGSSLYSISNVRVTRPIERASQQSLIKTTISSEFCKLI